MCFISLLLNKVRPSGAEPRVTQIVRNILPLHSKICVDAHDKHIQPSRCKDQPMLHEYEDNMSHA